MRAGSPAIAKSSMAEIKGSPGGKKPAKVATWMAWVSIFSALGLALTGNALGESYAIASLEIAAWLLFLAWTAQVLGWMLLSYALPALPASQTALLLLLQPAFAVILGVILLGEGMSWMEATGSVLLLVMIWLSQREQKRVSKPSSRT